MLYPAPINKSQIKLKNLLIYLYRRWCHVPAARTKKYTFSHNLTFNDAQIDFNDTQFV